MEQGPLTPLSDGSYVRKLSYSPKEEAESFDAKNDVPLPSVEKPEPSISRIRELLLMVILCAGQFLALAALAQTIAPQQIIGEDLHATSHGMLAWFTAAYSMVYASFIMPSGRLGDMWGSKKVVLMGYVVFGISSMFAGFASSEIQFCIARGVQGIGPALIVPNSIAIIARTWPMGDKRSMVISINGACGPTGFVTGALFSSIFATYTWWPWGFWAMSITCSVLSFLVYCFIDEGMARPATSLGVSPPKFDWLGCITGVAGLMLINFALNQAPIVGWSTHYIYLLLIAGVATFGLFIYIEFNLTDHPLVPVRGLQPQALMTLGCIAAGWASHGIWLYYFFLFMMNIREQSPLVAVAELVPVVPCGIIFALSTGFLLKKIHVSKLMLLALLCFSVGIIFLMTAPAKQSYWGLTFISTLITPAGMNWSFPAGVILLSSAMPREHQGKAASLVSTVVNYAIASGLGIAGSVERAVNHDGQLLLEGYRASWYTGSGFAVLGVLISIYFVWQSKHASLPK